MNKSGNGSRLWLWRLIKIILVASVIAAVIYWVKFSPVAVVAHKVGRGSVVAEVMGTGTLEARISTTISPKISGRVEEVLVDQGDRVAAGDLLVRLDDDELQQQVAIAQANVEAAAAALQRLKTDKDRATTVLAQAQRSQDRTESLSRQNAVSQDDIDRATEALGVAVVGVARAEAGIAEGQKEFVAAEKTLEYHQARLKDTQIVAPFDGMIVKRNREPGDVVVPGGSVLTLISTDELWISAWVDETEMARLETEQTAKVVFRSQPDCSYPGAVARLGREADRETREFIVDVRVLELPTNWAVGQRAEAFIKVAEANDVIKLPAKLIVKRGGIDGVFVNLDAAATWRPITLGLRNRDTVEVREGLEAGESVVTPISERAVLKDGQRLVTP